MHTLRINCGVQWISICDFKEQGFYTFCTITNEHYDKLDQDMLAFVNSCPVANSRVCEYVSRSSYPTIQLDDSVSSNAATTFPEAIITSSLKEMILNYGSNIANDCGLDGFCEFQDKVSAFMGDTCPYEFSDCETDDDIAC